MKLKNYKNRKIKVLLSNQSGMALLTTLIFTFVIATLAVALLTMTSNDIKLSSLQEDSTKAFYIAESGVQRSIKKLKNDFEWDGIFDDQDEEGFVVLGDGTFTVEIGSLPSDQVQLISTGRVNKAMRKIKVLVESTSSGGDGEISSIFKYAIASKTDLGTGGDIIIEAYSGFDESGNPIIVEGEGNVYAQGAVNVPGSCTIDGDVNTLDEVTITGSGQIKGNVNTDSTVYLSGSSIISGDVDALGTVTVSGGGSKVEGNVYTEGDVVIASSGKVEGDISSGGTVTSNSWSSEVGGNIDAEGDINMTGNIVSGNINSNQDITLNGGMTVNGGINTLGDINLTGWGSTIQEDIKSNGDIVIGNGWVVYGDVYANGTVSGKSNVQGTVYENLAEPLNQGATIAACEGFIPDDFPVIDSESYMTEAQMGESQDNDYTISGSGALTLGPIFIDGDLYVGGDVDITLGGTVYVTGEVVVQGSGDFNGPGTIVADGDISFGGARDINPEAMPVIMSVNGDININSANDIFAIIYAPNGTVSNHGGGNIYGSVIANNYTQNGSTKVYYYTALADSGANLPPEGGGEAGEATISVISWQEVY